MAAEKSGDLESTMYKLKMKRERLLRKIKEDEERLSTVNAQIESRSERLQKVTNRKNNRTIAKKEYEKTIMETESAYKKILDGSMAILGLLKVQANSGGNCELERELEEEHEAEETAKAEEAANAANLAVEEMAHFSQDESDEEQEEAAVEEANSVEDEEQAEEDEEEWEEEEEDEEEWEEEEVEEEE